MKTRSAIVSERDVRSESDASRVVGAGRVTAGRVGGELGKVLDVRLSARHHHFSQKVGDYEVMIPIRFAGDA